MIELIDNVYSVETVDIKKAVDILESNDIKSRDALHAATCKNRGIKKICTFDGHFDEISFLKRKEPDDLIKELKGT